MQRALVDFRASGSLTMASSFSSLIAQAQCLFGRYDEALVGIDEALAVIEETRQRAFEAEVHRTKSKRRTAVGQGRVERCSGRTVVSHGDRSRSRSESQIMGAARDDKSRSIAAQHQSPGRSAHDAG
jgi:hypothetical protein